MKPIALFCLLFAALAGCQSVAPQQMHALDELKAQLHAVGPVEAHRPLDDRLVLRVDVPAEATLAWDRAGRRVAVATRDTVRIIDPAAPDAPERQATFDPLEAPPRVLWLDGDRLWIAPTTGGLRAPFESEQPPPITGVVQAVGPTGQVVLAQDDGNWRFAVRAADRWRTRTLSWTAATPQAGLLNDRLLVPAPDGLHVIDAEGGESTLPWPEEPGRPRAIWSAAGRVCMAFDAGRAVFTAVDGPVRIEPGLPAGALTPEGTIVDGCVGAAGAALVVDDDGARLLGTDGVRSLDGEALAGACDPTGRRWAVMRRDGIYVGSVDGEARRVAAPSLRPAEVAGVTDDDSDRIWVLRADQALVEQVDGLEATGALPEPAVAGLARDVLAVAAGVALIAGGVALGEAIRDAEPGCLHRCY